ncbi:MAG: fibronectin type III domain-containing protein [Saprospiraceae bacterium]|nr:fibronectin type III domain-containing protein [Saprospiraceae bacterium]
MKNSFKGLLVALLYFTSFSATTAQGNGDPQVIPIFDQAESILASKIRLARESKLPFYHFNGLTPSHLKEDLQKYGIRKAETYKINKLAIQQLMLEQPEQISFTFNYRNQDFTIDLIKNNLLDQNFVVNSSSQGFIDYQPGCYFHGVLRGQMQMHASISIFENQIIGMLSMNGYNLVFQPSASHPDYLLIYDDRDIYLEKSFECRADELENSFKEDGDGDYGESAPGDCIRVYIECDYTLHQNKGGVANTVNWITAVYNNVTTLYNNESINTTISEVFVWTSSDPYSKTNSVTALNQFRSTRPSFNGDLAHLAALGGQNIGGVAWLNVLCTSYKYAYSNISSSYSNVPTYSWTVEVMTHEMGHNIGSNHTQWCGWAGGAIDNCYTPEGSCQPGPPPSNGGTIMSYCHLTQYGINFNNGFGPLPGDKIRSRVGAVTCLGTSCGGGGGSCSAPTGLNISNITSTSANAGWNSVSGATSYKFEYKKSTDPNWTQVTVTTTGYNMTGLTSSTTYNTRVKAVCSGTESAYSTQVNFTTSGGGGCGTPTNLTASNITSSSATLSWGAVSGANSYNFQYKVSTSQTWQQANVPTTSVNLTNLTASTTYNIRVQAVCGGTTGAFTSVLSFTTLSSGYCTSKGNNANYEWLARVKIGTIDRISGKDGGYYDGSAMVTDLTKGTSYTLNYQAGTTGSSGTLYWRAWIDFNNDGDFADAGEQILSSASASTSLLSRTFTVPSGAATAQVRLRVSVRYGGYPNPCGNFSYGEVEDYTLNLKVPGTLIGDPNQGIEEWTQVYPNPFTQQLWMDYNSVSDKILQIDIVDLLGKTIVHTKQHVFKGPNTIQLETNELKNSTYLIRIKDGEKINNYKVVKTGI